MVSKTPFIGLNKYSQGESGWTHSTDMEKLDSRVIESDTYSERPSEAPTNALFYATDRNLLYQYDGGVDDWVEIGGFGTDANPITETINGSDFSLPSGYSITEDANDLVVKDTNGTVALRRTDNGSWSLEGNDLDSVGTATVTTLNATNATVSSTPENEDDVARKDYVDSTKKGLDVKDSVRVATDGSNVDLTTTTDPNPIDGVSLSNGDRILLKDQTTESENGIYDAVTATDPTTWVRSDDADDDDEVTDGMFTFVTEGTANADTGYILTTNDPITVGTTSLTFTKFSRSAEILAGTNLNKSDNTLNVDLSPTFDTTNSTVEYQIDGNTLAQSVADTGQVSLTSGSATVSTGLTTTDATFYPAIGVDGGGSDITGLAAQLDYNSTSGEYELTIKETDSSVNPTVNYDIVRVR